MSAREGGAVAELDPRLKQPIASLTLAALGVVYGDIGTSPLYAAKETFNPDHGIALNTENILGGVSTIFWALMIVVSLKYVILIMRADNKGEGGIMALLALASSAVRSRPRRQRVILLLGVLGASLFYGDAVLTPAISVLSAVEGLEIGAPALQPYIVPIAVGVVIGLFVLQRQGTSLVGMLFGPVAALWFVAIAVLGIGGVAEAPEVLWSLNPVHALRFVTQHGFASFVVLGAVLLAFTGAEALYADMGHFGKEPIRIAWFALVLPALTLNYLGQGALLIAHPDALDNPFYRLAPDWALFPLVALATAATVIASQATISGTYSLTKQAIQLDYLPRMNVMQTSEHESGQIYIPGANWVLLAVIVAAVVGFGSSTRLAAAYGVAVTGTMLATTILTFFVIRYAWRYNLLLSFAATGFFILIDVAFFSSSLLKVAEGGWFPLALGAIVFTAMTTWHRGRELAMARHRQTGTSIDEFYRWIEEMPPGRVPGTAMFMAGNADAIPRAMLRNYACNHVLHERVVLLTVIIRDVPWVAPRQRLEITELEHGFYRMIVYFGFMDQPDVSQALEQSASHGLELDPLQTWFLLSRATIVPTPGEGMAMWRERMFAAMARNARTAGDYFNIPSDRVIELGTKIEI
jgi:KUP system potassium uptake protein